MVRDFSYSSPRPRPLLNLGVARGEAHASAHPPPPTHSKRIHLQTARGEVHALVFLKPTKTLLGLKHMLHIPHLFFYLYRDRENEAHASPFYKSSQALPR